MKHTLGPWGIENDTINWLITKRLTPLLNVQSQKRKEHKTMNTYIIVDDTPDGIGTCQITAADVRTAIEQAVKIFGLDVENVLAVIKK